MDNTLNYLYIFCAICIVTTWVNFDLKKKDNSLLKSIIKGNMSKKDEPSKSLDELQSEINSIIEDKYPQLYLTTRIPDYEKLNVSSPKNEFIQPDGMKAVAITKDQSLIILEYVKPFEITTATVKKYKFDDVCKFEILENKEVVFGTEINKRCLIELNRSRGLDINEIGELKKDDLILSTDLKFYLGSERAESFIFSYLHESQIRGSEEYGHIHYAAFGWLRLMKDIICNSNSRYDKEKRSKEDKANNSFKETYYQPDRMAGIGLIDDNENKNYGISILGMMHHRSGIGVSTYSYDRIISSEIIEDGSVITKSSGVIGRAIVGGVLTGGVGAIIGGVTATKRSSTEATSIKLRITVDDTNKPVHEISFLKYKTKKGSHAYNEAISAANHWHGLIDVLIHEKSQRNESTPIIAQQVNNTFSIADELKKLVELHDAGILTTEEFTNQKQKILNS